MDGQISSISVSSKKGSSLKDKHYQATTTANDSKLLQLDSIPSLSSQKFSQSSYNSTCKGINKSIIQIEKAQKLLISKFQKVKDNLIKEIQKKDQLNVQLQLQVRELKEELEDSRKDLTIITDYLKKKASCVGDKNRKHLLISTKNSDKIDKSKGGSKQSISINISSKDKYMSKKSSSPRATLFKKF